MPGIVGGFPNLKELNRRTIRGHINETDKSTIVSIWPKPIDFFNITLMPRTWHIDAGSDERPALLVVGSGSWWKDVHPDEPLIEIPVGSLSVAESLVKDYLNGVYGCDMDTKRPGLYFIPGKHDLASIYSEEHKPLLEMAIARQRSYYEGLILEADSLWARSNGNPLAIGGDMRQAATALGKLDLDWMANFTRSAQVRCFACGAFKSPDFPICQSCHTADPEHPKFKAVMEARKVQQDMFGGMERGA